MCVYIYIEIRDRLTQEGLSLGRLQEWPCTVHWKGNMWSQHGDSTTVSSEHTSPNWRLEAAVDKTHWWLFSELIKKSTAGLPCIALLFFASRESPLYFRCVYCTHIYVVCKDVRYLRKKKIVFWCVWVFINPNPLMQTRQRDEQPVLEVWLYGALGCNPITALQSYCVFSWDVIGL